MCLQRYILYRCVFASYQCHLIFYVSVRFHLSFQIHQEAVVLVKCLPCYSALFMLCDFKVQVLPSTTIGSQFHRSSQYTTACSTYACHGFLKVAGDILRQTQVGELDLTTQTADSLTLHYKRSIRSYYLIVETNLRVKPTQTRMTPRFVVAMIGYYIIGNIQSNLYGFAFGISGRYRQCALVSTCRKMVGQLSTNP